MTDTKRCAQCNHFYTRKSSRLSRSRFEKSKYCSPQCSQIARRSPPWRHERKNCVICGGEFGPQPSDHRGRWRKRRCCSHRCAAISRRSPRQTGTFYGSKTKEQRELDDQCKILPFSEVVPFPVEGLREVLDAWYDAREKDKSAKIPEIRCATMMALEATVHRQRKALRFSPADSQVGWLCPASTR